MPQISPEDERVLYEAGYLLLRKQQINAAREIFEGLSAMTPQKALPYIFLGRTYFSEKKYDEAQNWYRKALEIEPENALAMAHLGESFFVKRQKDEAIQTMKKALALDPNGESGQIAKSYLDILS